MKGINDAGEAILVSIIFVLLFLLVAMFWGSVPKNQVTQEKQFIIGNATYICKKTNKLKEGE